MVVDSTEPPGTGRLQHRAVSANKLRLISTKLRKNRKNHKSTSKVGPPAMPQKVDGRVGDRRRPASFEENGQKKSRKAYKKQ
jgi:hypothetical protein